MVTAPPLEGPVVAAPADNVIVPVVPVVDPGLEVVEDPGQVVVADRKLVAAVVVPEVAAVDL